MKAALDFQERKAASESAKGRELDDEARSSHIPADVGAMAAVAKKAANPGTKGKKVMKAKRA